MSRLYRAQKGFGLIEIVIASAVVGMVFVSLAQVFVLSHRLMMRTQDLARANFIAEEGVDAMRYLRDAGWAVNMALLAPNTNYYVVLATSSSQWSVGTADPGLIDGLFRRVISVQSVMRNGNDDIVSSGGITDTNTLKIISTVSWGRGTTSVETYLANIFNN